jgi:hypothetical protein
MSCREGNARRSVLDVLPAALAAGYVVLGVHGLLMLAGLDVVLWGPSLTPVQCFGALGLYLARRVLRGGPDRQRP